MKACDIMTKDVITARETDNIEKAVELLLNNKIGGLPVIDEERRVVGLVTETDLIYKDKDVRIPPYISLLGGYIFLKSIKKFEKQLEKMSADKVSKVMSGPPICVHEHDEINIIVDKMIENEVNRVPVTNDEDKLIGIITRSDILKSMYKKG